MHINAKHFYVKQIGIPVGLWKDCFYALIMGAQADNQHGTVYLNLKRHFKGNLEATKKAHDRFLELVDELITVTDQWRDYIYCEADRRYFYRHKGLKHWKNQCGMRFKEYGIRDDSKSHVLIDMEKNKVVTAQRKIESCKRRLAAFMLQGQEACFIHHLTVISTKKGIPVYKNEYDGLITGKEIPEELVQQAAKASGMVNPVLESKPLCTDEKKEEWVKYLRDSIPRKRS